MKQWLAVLTVLLAPAAWAAEGSALDKVLDCMRANIPKTVQIKQVELIATDRAGGERVLKGRLYGTNEKGRLRSMMRIEGPPELAGASYLLREAKQGTSDEMYIFVPALNKVRRITGASVDGALWGTDLSYSDVKQVQNAFSGAAARLEGSADVDKTPVHVLSFRPGVEQGSRYSEIRSWVDQKTCVALKVEFNEGATVRKRLSVHPKSLMQSAGHWYASEALMADVKEGTKTRIRVIGVTSDKNLADRFFNPGTFYIGN